MHSLLYSALSAVVFNKRNDIISHMLSPLGYPFGGDNHETKNEFLQPEGWLDKIQFFTDEIGQKVVEVPADCHHNQKHSIFIQERKWHLFPQEIVVHLVKQPFALAPVVVEFNCFKIGYLTVNTRRHVCNSVLSHTCR